MHRLRGALLIGSALLIAKLFLAGEMARYMSPALDPLTALTGVLLAAMGLVELRRPPAHGRHDHADGHLDAADPIGQSLTYLLVLLPLVLGLAVPPRALASSALGGESVASLLLSFGAGPAPAPGRPRPDPPASLTDLPDLLAYLRQAGEAGLGQPVRAVGLVARSDALPRNEFALLRYTVAHCVADARPFSLLVVGEDGGWPTDQWVEVEGVLASRARGGDRLVAIEAVRVVAVEEPRNPYLPPLH
ncbi:MAG TPA: TIGR03943 family protein [Chloroflexota bacterium]|jgi:uncharacterized repeat protein (TIGR03943 family)